MTRSSHANASFAIVEAGSSIIRNRTTSIGQDRDPDHLAPIGDLGPEIRLSLRKISDHRLKSNLCEALEEIGQLDNAVDFGIQREGNRIWSVRRREESNPRARQYIGIGERDRAITRQKARPVLSEIGF